MQRHTTDYEKIALSYISRNKIIDYKEFMQIITQRQQSFYAKWFIKEIQMTK